MIPGRSPLRLWITFRSSYSAPNPPRRAGPSDPFRFLFTCFFFALLALPAPASPQGAASVEYQVKAAFLLNFAKFVEWPAGAFAGPSGPIFVCVLGHDSFGSALDDVLRGQTINNHPLRPLRITSIPDLKSCQMAFVSQTENKRLPAVLAALKGSGVLTVGESLDFASQGGAIQFYLQDGRVHFAVNVDAVQRAHLTLSSKLLALAKIVHDGDHFRGS